MTDRNRERGRGSGGVFSTQINTRLINNRASGGEEREKKSRLDRVKYVSNQIRVRLNAANLLLAARTSAAVQRAVSDAMGRFILSFFPSCHSTVFSCFMRLKCTGSMCRMDFWL